MEILGKRIRDHSGYESTQIDEGLEYRDEGGSLVMKSYINDYGRTKADGSGSASKKELEGSGLSLSLVSAGRHMFCAHTADYDPLFIPALHFYC